MQPLPISIIGSIICGNYHIFKLQSHCCCNSEFLQKSIVLKKSKNCKTSKPQTHDTKQVDNTFDILSFDILSPFAIGIFVRICIILTLRIYRTFTTCMNIHGVTNVYYVLYILNRSGSGILIFLADIN